MHFRRLSELEVSRLDVPTVKDARPHWAELFLFLNLFKVQRRSPSENFNLNGRKPPRDVE